jgi:hypothetical protein
MGQGPEFCSTLGTYLSIGGKPCPGLGGRASGVFDLRESLVTAEFEDLGVSTNVTVVHDNLDSESGILPYESG